MSETVKKEREEAAKSAVTPELLRALIDQGARLRREVESQVAKMRQVSPDDLKVRTR